MFQLYKYLARRTGSKFNEIITRRLRMARRFRAPLSLSRLVRVVKASVDIFKPSCATR